MKKLLLTLYLLSGIASAYSLFSQQDSSATQRRHRWYIYWGYNRSVYSKSNLHFNGPNYDFTLYDLKATDKPEKFGWVYIDPRRFSIPQYNIRLGYFINRHFDISFGMDHMKYVVTPYQRTRISGVITPQASEKYAGSYLNQSIELSPEVLMFEHTNGFNLVSLDLEWITGPRLSQRPLSWAFNMGLGGIWLVTKTDVRIFWDGIDNDFHVAGYTMAGKLGGRLEWKKRVFFMVEGKCGYGSLPSVLVKNDASEIGDHNVLYLEGLAVAGVYFGRRR